MVLQKFYKLTTKKNKFIQFVYYMIDGSNKSASDLQLFWLKSGAEILNTG
jgi:hypothetical protein